MTPLAFLVVLIGLIVLLLYLVRGLYSDNARPEVAERAASDFKDDRLATLVEPELMEWLMEKSRAESRPAVDMVNDLIRIAFRDSSESPER